MLRCGVCILIFILGGGAGYGVALYQRSLAEKSGRVVDLSVRDGGLYRVRKVTSGDTVILDNGLRVRYDGVETPPAGRFVKDAAPLAAEATARNVQLVEGKRVRLRLARDPFDINGRILARVYAQPEDDTAPEVDAVAVLLKEGWGKAQGYRMTFEEIQTLKALESKAQANKAGIWGLEGKPRAENAKPYCAASNKKVYHLAACSEAQRIKPENRHEYNSAAEAEEAGLKPCHICMPK